MDNEGESALRDLDDILAHQPKPEKHLYSRCTASLALLRDQMIDAGADRTRLAHVNAVISVVLAGHFPLGPVPWNELQKARGWLAVILEG